MIWEKNPSPERIAEVIALTQGRGGSEDESAVRESAWEVADGYVSAYFGAGSRAARLLRRAGSAVKALALSDVDGHIGVHVQVDASAFRGLEYAFKNLDNKTTMSDEAKARLGGA